MIGDRVIAVAGGGRCGTSLVMQMLAAAGLDTVGTAPAFEVTRWSNQCHRDPATALRKARGRAVKILPPALQAVVRLKSGRRIERIDWVWLTRDLDQQALSIAKFARMVVGLPTMPTTKLRLQLEGEASIPQTLSTYPSNRVLSIAFEDVINNPQTMAQQIATFLNLTRPVTVMAGCVIPRATDCYPGLLELQLLQQQGQA